LALRRSIQSIAVRRPRGQLVGSARQQPLPRLERLARRRPRPGDVEPAGAAGAVGLELEAGNDAEVAAPAATTGPEEVGVRVAVDATDLAVGGDEPVMKLRRSSVATRRS
jgi:hypothetical protein